MAGEPTPRLAEDDQLEDLLAEWLEAAEAGTPPDPAAFAGRLPHLAEAFLLRVGHWEHFRAWAERLHRLSANAGSPPAPAPPRPPDLPDYEILGELGRGGMGVVYRARQRSLGRLVALKVLRPGGGSADDVRRFRNEATIVAGLDHPGIVPIYEVGERAGQPFYSMKLIEGADLDERAPSLAGDPAVGAGLVAAVARAVHHAHLRGVLHRDLKPSNILLDEGGGPHVTDFGLAKQVFEDSGLTQPGSLVGTPSYMAPEQTRAAGNLVTTATDVYGLGAILYSLLTGGRPPFRGETVLETIRQVQGCEVVAPSSHNPAVPADLQTICLRCLEKDPASRYASAEAVADDLDRWRRGEPILARPSTARERLLKWARRRPAEAALVGVAAAASLGLVLGLWLYTRQLGDALAQSDRLRGEAVEREGALRRLLYVADLRAARQAWESTDVEQAARLLLRHVPREGEEDVRDFAWHHLDRVCRFTPVLLGRHAAGVRCLAASPDGRWAVSGDTSGVLKAWDLTTGACRDVPLAPGRELCAAGFSPDGRLLAVGGTERAIRLVEVGSWGTKASLVGFLSTVRSVAFSPDGTRLAAGLVDDTVKLWDVPRALPAAVWRGHTDDVQALAWSADGSRLVTASSDSSFRIWDTTSGKEQFARPRAHRDTILVAGFVPGRRPLVYTAGYDHVAKLWEAGAASEWATLELGKVVRAVAVAPDGRWLVAAGADGRLLYGEIPLAFQGIQARRTFRHGEEAFRAAVATAAGRAFLTGAEDGEIRAWDVAGCTGVRATPVPAGIAALSPDGTRCVSGDSAGRLSVWDNRSGAAEVVLPGTGSLVTCAAISPGAGVLAFGHADGTVSTWDRAARRRLALIPPGRGKVLGVGFDRAGDRLAVATSGGQPGLFDARTGEPVGPALAPVEPKVADADEEGVCPVHFSPGGKELVVAQQTRSRLTVWDLESGRAGLRLDLGDGYIHGAAVSPDGLQVAVAQDHFIHVFGLRTGKREATFPGHKGAVHRLAYSHDGRLLASTGVDNTVRLWHLRTHQQLYTLHDCREQPRDVVFAPDGSGLAVACGVPGHVAEVLTFER